jgi:hypothetical protein
MKRTTFLFCLVIYLMTQPLRAAVVEDLYSVELPVADQTTAQRLSVFNQAFRNVIVKLTGSQAVLEQPSLKRPLNNSARYVRQFRYFQRELEATDEMLETSQLMLKVTFNQEALEDLLRENGIAIWGKQRPNTLLLISYDVNKNISLISSDTNDDMVGLLDDLANQLGLPVLYPLLDLEDRVQLGVKDVLDLNEQSIETLAARYAPDAVLIGNITGRTGKGWEGRWQIRTSTQIANWNHQARSRDEVMHRLMARLAQTLAGEYALDAYVDAEEDILFTVDGVFQVQDHIKVQSYLQSLDAVELSRPVQFTQDKVVYRVTLHSSSDDLTRLIGLGNVLELVELPQIDVASETQTINMHYRFVQ